MSSSSSDSDSDSSWWSSSSSSSSDSDSSREKKDRKKKKKKKKKNRRNNNNGDAPPTAQQGNYGKSSSSKGGGDMSNTRWEKALLATTSIIQKVSKASEKDGVDVFCFPGKKDHVDVYRRVKKPKSIKKGIASVPPQGPCFMGYALDMVFKEAFERGFDKKPTTILVVTAGRPDDHEQLVQNIRMAAKNLQSEKDLSVTFVQVGDDEWATTYLKYLDDHIDCIDANGKKIDIVDTIKDEDVQKAVKEMKDPTFMNSGGGGGLLGGFMGVALGVGGVYMYNKIQAKKRTQGWNGDWKVMQQGTEVARIKVEDDMAGKLTIINDPIYNAGSYKEDENGFSIDKTTTIGSKTVKGLTIEDDGHDIEWADGTSWEEIPPDGALSWKAYTGAAVGGAVVGGAVGYLTQKKFFDHAANKCKDNYVIIIDRSEKMAVADYGKSS